MVGIEHEVEDDHYDGEDRPESFDPAGSFCGSYGGEGGRRGGLGCEYSGEGDYYEDVEGQEEEMGPCRIVGGGEDPEEEHSYPYAEQGAEGKYTIDCAGGGAFPENTEQEGD